jgi:hypothetical protein
VTVVTQDVDILLCADDVFDTIIQGDVVEVLEALVAANAERSARSYMGMRCCGRDGCCRR